MIRERTREQQLQTDLSKFFKPVIEMQKATTREITEGLKPIKEGIENLPQAITFPAYPSIQAFEKPVEGEEDAPYVGEIAKTYLKSLLQRTKLIERTDFMIKLVNFISVTNQQLSLIMILLLVKMSMMVPPVYGS